ncbi:hypothetical protein SNOUR_02730 [Streptomyces noursei ATCC 11455]|nr:hypothetical protein SNOUR_02730 [Streptomyces noursei ATCC 11455]
MPGLACLVSAFGSHNFSEAGTVTDSADPL